MEFRGTPRPQPAPSSASFGPFTFHMGARALVALCQGTFEKYPWRRETGDKGQEMKQLEAFVVTHISPLLVGLLAAQYPTSRSGSARCSTTTAGRCTGPGSQITSLCTLVLPASLSETGMDGVLSQQLSSTNRAYFGRDGETRELCSCHPFEVVCSGMCNPLVLCGIVPQVRQSQSWNT